MKKINLTKKSSNLLKAQLKAFKKKFGREPGPDDPVFFDPDYDSPTPISEEKLIESIIEASTKAGIDSHKALLKFGFTEEEIKAYLDSIEYQRGKC